MKIGGFSRRVTATLQRDDPGPSETRTALESLIAEADALKADLGFDWKGKRPKWLADALSELEENYSKRLKKTKPKNRQAVIKVREYERQQIPPFSTQTLCQASPPHRVFLV